MLSPICSVPGNSHLLMIGCMLIFLHYFILWHTYSTKQSALYISHQLVAGRSKVMTLWGYWPALVSLSVRVSEFHYDTGWVPATNYFPIVPCVHSTSNRWQYSRYDSLSISCSLPHVGACIYTLIRVGPRLGCVQVTGRVRLREGSLLWLGDRWPKLLQEVSRIRSQVW